MKPPTLRLTYQAIAISLVGYSSFVSMPVVAQGKIIIEAENYSLLSEGPSSFACEACSGGGRLGDYQNANWFEVSVNIPEVGYYNVLLAAANQADRTEVEVALVDGEKLINLTKTDFASTGSWDDYVEFTSEVVALPKGENTIRFTNVGLTTNIDYVGVSAASAVNVAVFNPEPNEGPVKNPLKGFNSGWWHPGEEEWSSIGYQAIEWRSFERCTNDDGSVAAVQTFAECDNEFDYAEIERIISERPGSAGRHVVLQLITDQPNAPEIPGENGIPLRRAGYVGPEWLRNEIPIQDNGLPGEFVDEARAALPEGEGREFYSATNYDSPFFKAQAKEVINALVERYKDDPRVFVLQTGILGFYGEWQTTPYQAGFFDERWNPDATIDWSPSDDTRDFILGNYLEELGIEDRDPEKFADHFTQVRYPDAEENKRKEGPGMGYVNGYFIQTPDGKKFIEDIVERGLWKFGPVGGEWPPSNAETLSTNEPRLEEQCIADRPGESRNCWELFLDEDGEQLIRDGRYTHILPPENPVRRTNQELPGWESDSRFMRLHRMFGYNFQVEEVRHAVAASGSTFVEVDLKNVGIAPFYKDWQVQLAVLDATTKEVVSETTDDAGNVVKGAVNVDTDIRSFAPDQAAKTISASFAAQLDPAKTYEIALRIQQPDANFNDKLDARNLYVVLANEVDVVEGGWKDPQNPQDKPLVGGWNILGDLQLADQVLSGQAPVLAALSDVSLAEGESVSVAVSSTDADGDTVSLSLGFSPTFCELTDNGDGTGSILCSAPVGAVGDYSVSVVATDSGEQSSSAGFTVVVSNGNSVPVLANLSEVMVDEGASISLPITSSDADHDTATLSVTGLASFCTLLDNSDGTGSIDCSPTLQDAGIYSTTIKVSDPEGAFDKQILRIIVNDVVDVDPVALCAGLPVTIMWGPDARATNADDVIMGTPDVDIIHGLGGNDVICGAGGNDQLFGGKGRDTLFGGEDNDYLFGGPDADTQYGGSGKDRLFGGAGADTQYGGTGKDTLFGGAGRDTQSGGAGNDRIFGGAGIDELHGNADNDRLFGGAGVDTLFGGPGNDTLNGGRANDILFGDGGDDSLNGQAGNDVCDGGDTDEVKGDTATRSCETRVSIL